MHTHKIYDKNFFKIEILVNVYQSSFIFITVHFMKNILGGDAGADAVADQPFSLTLRSKAKSYMYIADLLLYF